MAHRNLLAHEDGAVRRVVRGEVTSVDSPDDGGERRAVGGYRGGGQLPASGTASWKPRWPVRAGPRGERTTRAPLTGPGTRGQTAVMVGFGIIAGLWSCLSLLMTVVGAGDP
jgi:hypothetical protein